ncbi:hypothetical protein [Fulvivirga ligni]|uniref:hypothetical protein n=1 Tax=Fulvivirga ligni TaxID=2904246 RepID=UPI001F16A68F|nr:hypothetical protein [Fulvivirga ligni]UII23223.1 hypothetical protein LVD16_08285 [Fulvivirga ligni]
MKTEQQGRAEKMFQDIGKGIDGLIEDLHKAKERAKVEYADEINELKRSGDKLNEEINNFRNNNKDKFDDVEKSLQKAAHELRNAFETMFKKKKED